MSDCGAVLSGRGAHTLACLPMLTAFPIPPEKTP